MGIKDDINLILRDHEGYTGDGRGGVGDLPVGDRSTARKPISKRDLREVLGAVHDSVADPANAAMQAAEDAIDAAERAETAAAGVEYPVSYAPQTLTEPQKAQARGNIGLADLGIGVGTGAAPFLANISATDTPSGVYRVSTADTTGTFPFDATFGVVQIWRYTSSFVQIFTTITGDVRVFVRRYLFSGSSGSWSNWRTLNKIRDTTQLDVAGVSNGSLSNLGADLYEIKLSVSSVASASAYLFFRVRVTGDEMLTSGYTVLATGGTGLEVTGSTGEWLRIPINSTVAYRVTRHGRTQYWGVEVMVNGQVGYAVVNTGAAATRVTGVNLGVTGGVSFTTGNLYGRTEDFI